MRLIDADALIAEYDRVHIGAPGGARKLMQDAPTVDAVEVVRCKNCKRMETTQSVLHWCNAWKNRVKEDGFCSYGERRNDG